MSKRMNNVKYEKGIVMPIVKPLPIEKIDKELSWWKKIWAKFKRKFVYRRKWILIEDYVLYIPWLDKWLFVPKQFIFDFASVPKLLHSIYGSTNLLLFGSVPHDFGYRYAGLLFINPINNETYFERWKKSDLDKLFNELNKWETGLSKGTFGAYAMLRLVGFTGWKENRKKNLRIYEDFPNYLEI